MKKEEPAGLSRVPSAIIPVQSLSELAKPEPSDLEKLFTMETRNMLAKVNTYNFPIFDFAESTKNQPLLVLAKHLVVDGGLLERLQLPTDKFITFIHNIEIGYKPELRCKFNLIMNLTYC